MRIKKVVVAIVATLVCMMMVVSTLFVSGQQGLAWLSVRYHSGGKLVAVRDKESVNQLRDAVKEVRHQGQKVDAADYETTYGSSLFLVNWICPVQIKGAYPKSADGQRDDGQNDNEQRSDELHSDSNNDDGYLVQIGFETYQIGEEQYDLLLAPYITVLREAEYCEDEYAQTN